MPFMPFFKRPDPDVIYLDKVVASVEIAGYEVWVCRRGVGIEKVDEANTQDNDKEGSDDWVDKE